MQISVQDTGIGIKKEDFDKLFESFQQLDSKRNRNIEGSGLGLAISKRLVTLMNGNLWVESEYGKGSTFSFEIPQIVLKNTPSIEIYDNTLCAATLCNNQYINDSLERDFKRFGIKHIHLLPSDPLQLLNEKNVRFFFIDYPSFTNAVCEFVEHTPSITAILMIDFKMTVEYHIPNLIIVKKPLYSLNIGTILNHGELYRDYDPARNSEFSFIAPEAEILIVDDNEINLTVAAGLMEPLQMKIDTALS